MDNYISEDIRPLIERDKEIVRLMEENATAIQQNKRQIATAEEKLYGKGAIEEGLRRMAELDFVVRLKTKSTLDKEGRLITRAQSEVDKVANSLRSMLGTIRVEFQILDDSMIADLSHQQLLTHHYTLLQTIDTELESTLSKLIYRIHEIWAEGEQERGSWQTDYDIQDSVYQELLREFQSEGEGINPDRYINLQNRLAQLQQLEAETEERRRNVGTLYEARRGLIAELQQIRRCQYELRCEKAAELTKSLKEMVRITIHPQGNREVLKDYLVQLCRGLSVYNSTLEQLAKAEAETPEREAQKPVDIKGERKYLISPIPRYLEPVDLAEAIRSERECDNDTDSPLNKRWGISSEAMRRNISKLDEERLFELEVFNVPDMPLIELRVGSGLLGYRPLSALSVGQKCTALLGIVLLESPATLLVDQPEDDLDNQFIFDQIVDTLRHEKERRQFIVATHNANIPVSGDAELIVVVEADEYHGWVPENGAGSIDAKPIKQAVEQILEGGERAFQIRREKYGLF